MTRSCNSPLEEMPVPPSTGSSPLLSVKRPPASVTTSFSAAKSHRFARDVQPMSAVPRATRRCDIELPTPRANLWDFAALKLVVTEAGGRFTDRSGDDPVLGGTGISSNGLLHDLVI